MDLVSWFTVCLSHTLLGYYKHLAVQRLCSVSGYQQEMQLSLTARNIGSFVFTQDFQLFYVVYISVI